MRGLAALLVAFAALATPARADVSDSGNLNIGGQAVIGGTMTVQGSEFSVGGSSFSVSAGTAQVGGLLRTSSLGIQWADGSVSTTASAGGSACADCAQLSSTQVFSGADAFVSSVTVGPQIVTTTASWATVIKGNWSLLASTHVVAASAIYFYGLVSTSPYSAGNAGRVKYRIDYNYSQVSSVAVLYMNYNDESASNSHVWAMYGEAEPSGYSLSNAGGRDTKCYLSYSNGEVAGGRTQTLGEIYFAPAPGDDTLVQGHYQMSGYFNTGDYYGLSGVCSLISGAKPLSSVKISPSSGGMTGDFSLWGMVIP